MPKLTVFTPTYNRKDLLVRGYEALRRQTSKDFLWLIIDDGSTDSTGERVKNWQMEADFEIRYVYKENGGLYTGYNKAIELLETELAVCIDSDDFMPDDAVERIIDFWNKNGSSEYAGIVGLDISADGRMLGDLLPNVKSLNLADMLINRYKIQDCDRKFVVRTDLYKKYGPMEIIEGEKDYNPHSLHVEISQDYEFLVCNENFCFVEYQEGGMTQSIFKQYVNSPKSYAKMRILNLNIKNAPIKYVLKNCIHYVSSSILSHNNNFIKQSPRKVLTVLMIPFGALFTLYVKRKAKK